MLKDSGAVWMSRSEGVKKNEFEWVWNRICIEWEIPLIFNTFPNYILVWSGTPIQNDNYLDMVELEADHHIHRCNIENV